MPSLQEKQAFIEKVFDETKKRMSKQYIDLGNDIRVRDGCCFGYNSYNCTFGGWKHLNLRLCAGSLGVGKTDPFFEYGFPEATTIRPFLHLKEHKVLDAHVWLENENGEIYDIFTKYLAKVCEKRKKEVDAYEYEILDGHTVEELADAGLHYVKAPPIVEAVLLRMFSKISIPQ